jgi:phospholipase/lecithinase/hemolysin
MMRAADRRVPWSLHVLAGCLILLLVATGSAGAQSRFSGFVVFGTSLSDPGNAFALLGEASTPADFSLNPFLIPSAPYAAGGHHFSNGATWIEQFARSVALSQSTRPAFATANPSATNFAVAAARAYEDGTNYNLTRQVHTFLARSGGSAAPDRLYVIEMGSNDIRDSFQVYAVGGNGAPILQMALASIAANIQTLYAAGAREFLVWVAPNVALTPAIRSLGPAAGALATAVTQGFNGGLDQVVTQLSFALPGASFHRLDAWRLLNDINSDPSAFDFANVTAACVTPNVPPFTCQQPDEYLFWDGIHPTKAGHAWLAREAAAVVQ